VVLIGVALTPGGLFIGSCLVRLVAGVAFESLTQTFGAVTLAVIWIGKFLAGLYFLRATG
jgi:hypothetical protein